jgi:hypothetical protein
MLFDTQLSISGVRSPVLHCPFPSAQSPHADTIERGTLAWAKGLGLFDRPGAELRFLRAGAARRAGRAFPDAPLPALALAADFLTWFFLQGDACEEEGLAARPRALAIRFDRFRAVMRGGPATASDLPATRGLADLRRRMLAARPGAWFARFTAALGAHFDACVREAELRATGATPGVEECLALRRAAGGLSVELSLFELAAGADLPEAAHDHIAVRALARHACEAAAIAGDIFSYERRAARGEVVNLVAAIQREQGVKLQLALDQAASLCNATVRRFSSWQAQVPSLGDADPLVRRYIACMGAFLRATLECPVAGRRRGASIDPPPSSRRAA